MQNHSFYRLFYRFIAFIAVIMVNLLGLTCWQQASLCLRLGFPVRTMQAIGSKEELNGLKPTKE